jgi:hypothetical protein
MNPLLQKLRSQAPWLFDELRLEVTSYSYSEKYFGNSIVVLHSKDMKLRFVQDRGQILVDFEVPAEPGKWWSLYFLLDAIQGSAPTPIFDLDGIVARLRQNLTGILEALGPGWSKTKQELERRREERSQALRRRKAQPVGRFRRFASMMRATLRRFRSSTRP